MNAVSRRLVVLTVISLVVAVAALGLAAFSLYRSDPANRDYDAAQVADAKARACASVDIVRRGVSLNTNLMPAGGAGDVTGAQAVAANARVSLYDGGQYLLARLDPATPEDLAAKVREFAENLMDIGANATAGVTNDDPAQAQRLKNADDVNASLEELCK
ncbi:hypothetical protein [Mycolicibacterium gadium]|uniref:Alanine and proline rich membrane protein n=1 Tax=Mycolicibacterium gadium TaxID=1794 RepID=A0A7I7WJW4_MYCGU|nr:hypothetical protein [Mycolicibacterium gadium]BBZ16783.1 hypothetical protein MGAD_11180 [Mycolicibacterium gadium]